MQMISSAMQAFAVLALSMLGRIHLDGRHSENAPIEIALSCVRTHHVQRRGGVSVASAQHKKFFRACLVALVAAAASRRRASARTSADNIADAARRSRKTQRIGRWHAE